MSNTENPMANISKVEQLDEKFKNLPKSIKECKDKANSLLSSVKARKAKLIQENQRREEELAKQLADPFVNEIVETAQPVVEEHVEKIVEESPVVKVAEIVKEQNSEVEEAVKIEKEDVVAPVVEVAEDKSTKVEKTAKEEKVAQIGRAHV